MRVWLRFLQRIHRPGELILMNLRPEGLSRWLECLDPLPERARATILPFGSPPWATWPPDGRSARRLTSTWGPLGDGLYKVEVTGTDRAVLLVRNLRVQVSSGVLASGSLHGQCQRGNRGRSKLPCTGIGHRDPPWAATALRNMGFIVEQDGERDEDDYRLHIDRSSSFEGSDRLVRRP